MTAAAPDGGDAGTGSPGETTSGSRTVRTHPIGTALAAAAATLTVVGVALASHPASAAGGAAAAEASDPQAVAPRAVVAAGPPAPTGTLVGSWQFDGPAGSTSEPDSSGTGNTATPDPRHPGVSWGRWEPTSDSGYAHFADGILQTPNSATLVPGDRDIRVDVRVRVTNGAKGNNIIQKGTSTDTSGFWKIETTYYITRCRFLGAQGSARLQSHAVINDGRWHTITCTKTASAADLWVDGALEDHQDVVVGANTNTTDGVSIGGKTINGSVSPDDELGGDLDYATYRLG
ncbi:hypothetical protein GCM10009814_33090 [Lapillicoccus jejuensis]